MKRHIRCLFWLVGGECGDGTIVFNSAGSSTFDISEPASDIPTSSDTT